MPAPRPPKTARIHPHLLITSLGNPSPYTNTLHSAGHHLLARLAVLLSAPSLSADAKLARGQCSYTHHPSDPHVLWTLWQSPVQMNTSGRAVKSAWAAWCDGIRDGQCGGVSGDLVTPAAGAAAPWKRISRKRLVVLHDELEAPLGKIKIRGGLDGSGGGKGDTGSKLASAKGHNGVKSVLDAFPMRDSAVPQKLLISLLGAPAARPMMGTPKLYAGVEGVNRSSIVRVGVGIGRPESRDPADVSRFVLRRMSERERRSVELAAEEVLERLKTMTIDVPVEDDG